MHLDFSALRVAIVGDLILDRYLEGAVGRISPEAPVPVLLREAERDVLGGAANVAANLASLGAQVQVVGLVGADDNGSRITGLLDTYPGMGTTGVVVDPARPTTCKTRVLSGLYQLVRIDAETTDKVAGALEGALIEAAARAINWAEVVALSDYAKGVCSDRVIRAVIELAKTAGKPCIVDPKRKDFSIYRGAAVIKPNRGELSEAARTPCGTDDEVEAAARAMIAQTGSGILLTRSEQGMSYVGPDSDTVHMPTAAKNVFDVSGAGDTVIAMASIAMAARMSKVEMMRLANMAAGIVVGKVGTAVVSIAELDAALGEEAHQPTTFNKGALVSLEDAVRQRRAWRRRGLRVGFTNGCFDLLHPGHVSLLRRAAEECDRLIVAINTDSSVQRLKGPSRPVQSEEARAYVLGGLSSVDLVIVFDENTPAEAIAAIEPDLLVKGADYAEDQVVGADVVRAGGGRVLLVPVVAGQSTSSMIQRSQRLAS